MVALVYLAPHAHALMNQLHRGVAFAGPRRCSSLLSTLCLSLAGSTELLVPAMAAAPARSLQINHGQRGKDGTGAMVWHAALILAEWLGDNADQISGTSVLELGAGTGACSIFAAGLGASRVMATDGEEGLRKLAADNFELNRKFYPCAEVGSTQYLWGDVLPECISGVSWDWVIGADVTYSQKSYSALCSSLCKLCADSDGGGKPRVLLSHTHRLGLGIPSLESFCDTAASSGLQTSVLHRGDRAPPIELAAFYGKGQIVGVSIIELGLRVPLSAR